MKKILLSLAALTAFSAAAEKVAFVCTDGKSFYNGDAKTVVYLPAGSYLTNENEYKPTTPISKSFTSDFVEISAGEAGDFGFAKASKTSTSYVTSGGFRWYTNQALKFTPAKGITLKGVSIKDQRLNDNLSYPANYVFPFTVNTADTKATFSNETSPWLSENIILSAELNSAEPVYLQPTGQNRCYYIEVEFEGTLAQAKMPVCSANFPYVAADEEITLTAEAGADIYYTLDGTLPTAESTKYTAPFKLAADGIIRAIAVKDGTQSFPYYGEFFVVPAGLKVAQFNYSDWQSLTLKDGGKLNADMFIPDTDGAVPPCNASLPITDKTFTANGVDVTFANGVEGEDKRIKIFRSWTFGNVVELRPVSTTSSCTYTVADGNKIQAIVVVGSQIATQDSSSKKVTGSAITVTDGTFAISPVCSSYGIWKGDAQSVKLSGGVYIDQVYVLYKDNGAGVADITTDNNVAVEYYNLQGVKVANPENGIFVRKEGNKVSKVMVK